ncbi:MAG: hypothetical protein ACLR23_21545 [Clostridia bacterium]
MPAGNVEMIKAEEKWEEKCTLRRRGTAGYQRAHGGKLPAGSIETATPAEKQNENARR